MGDALRKSEGQKPEFDVPEIDGKDTASSHEAIEVLDLEPVPSPAKALQTRLDQHFSLRQSKFSGRFITFLVLGTCSATWLSGFGLYATL